MLQSLNTNVAGGTVDSDRWSEISDLILVAGNLGPVIYQMRKNRDIQILVVRGFKPTVQTFSGPSWKYQENYDSPRGSLLQ